MLYRLYLVFVLVTVGNVCTLSAVASADDSVAAGELRAAPTIHSYGIEWGIEGDANHNATCTVRYREADGTWRDALDLLRIDYRGWYADHKVQAHRHQNMMAGSIMFLKPATAYEVELKLTDPDGGEATKELTFTTRAEPALTKPARMLHVAPGDGGGSGTVDDPFLGLAAADSAAQPGDLFLLRSGKYVHHTLVNGGESGRHVAYRGTGDGEAIIVGHLGVAASHVWIENLVFESTGKPEEFCGVRGKGHPYDDVVVVRNLFRNCRYAVSNTERSWNGDPAQLNRHWYIADNVFEGGPFTEYFTRVYLLTESDIAYNKIACTLNGKGGDAIAARYCTNLDVYGNDIYETDDDLFEPDSAYANIRIWRNRAVNPKFEAVSFQPQLMSPWYIVQNEFVLFHPTRYNKAFKTNVYDRNVIVNNTFAVRGRYGQYRADVMLSAYARNNLWVLTYDNPAQKTNAGGAIWYGGSYTAKDETYLIRGQEHADWKSNVDHEGFAWDDVPDMNVPFWWNNGRYATPKALAEAIGIGSNLFRVDRSTLFTVDDLLAYSTEGFSLRRLTLGAGSDAIDKGAIVPNLNDDFEGHAPDLGAYEHGRTPWHVGPRP